MKVLQVLHQFLPLHMAGSEIYTFHLCRELQKRHDVHLVFTERRPEASLYSTREGEYQGIPFTEVVNNHESLSFETSYLNPRIEEAFTKILDSFQPDIVHIQHLVLLSMSIINMLKKRNIPVVLTFHEYWYQCPANGQKLRPDHTLCHDVKPEQCAECLVSSPYLFRGNSVFQAVQARGVAWANRFLPSVLSRVFDGLKGPALKAVLKREAVMRKALSQVDVFVAPSRFLRDDFIRWGAPAEKIVYSDYGFSKEGFDKFTKKKTGKIRFAFIGSIMPHKGVHVLIQAFEGVPEDKAALSVYGNLNVKPPYANPLVKQAEKYPHVEFKGEWNTHQIEKAYEEIDVLIVPSIWFENSPLTIHEALMAGIPVITSDLGGMAELVQNGRNGLLFQTGSSEDLRRCILEFIRHPDLLNKLSGSPDSVKSIEENAEEMEVLYENLLCRTAH